MTRCFEGMGGVVVAERKEGDEGKRGGGHAVLMREIEIVCMREYE